MVLQESGEMYLETILVLSKKSPYVRSIDISEYRNYSKPSVSRAMKLLRDSNYISIDDNGFITLTPTGLAVAEGIYEKHSLLTEYLIRLGVDEKIASEDACKIEHVISEETFLALKKHAAEKGGI